ncbi:hypothetical protein [Mycolicibacterium iranicum]|uniref:Uncharacterized protein n=1 Tax=Mycolicibacterium iranicum TaxID=912594 RepID=A0ABT4HAF7_MYCIR|nr:hypothetical protein [Mycolicibacterium iranicum]MCZ0727195.1 hypothetical protein [Mycolicibacterium iranicum]
MTFPYEKPPKDVVPPTPPTREDILRWNAMVGTVMNVSEPGEIISDPDSGLPLGVGPTATTRDTIGSIPVTRDQLAAVGLTEDDVPNLTIIDREGN